jgi:predicted branched-subunit amino acid permease
MYGNWALFTWVGLTLGGLVANAAAWGFDFAMVATFIGMVVPYLTRSPMVITVIVAGLVAAVAYPLPYQLGIVVAAVAGVIAGMLSDRCGSDRWGSGSHVGSDGR